jgi:hypothetical protein
MLNLQARDCLLIARHWAPKGPDLSTQISPLKLDRLRFSAQLRSRQRCELAACSIKSIVR